MTRVKLIPGNYVLEDTGMLVTIGNERFISEYDAEILLSLLKHSEYNFNKIDAMLHDCAAELEEVKDENKRLLLDLAAQKKYIKSSNCNPAGTSFSLSHSLACARFPVKIKYLDNNENKNT